MSILRSYARRLNKANSNLTRGLINHLSKNFPPDTKCRIFNAIQGIVGRSARFKYDTVKHLYLAEEDRRRYYFPSFDIGNRFFANGMTAYSNWLFRTYSLQLISFRDNDIVVDCGANFGGLFVKLRTLPQTIKYVSFEPAPDEFRCLSLNAPEQANNNIALYDKVGEFEFFISSEGGDSSLMQPSAPYSKTIPVRTTTIDEYFKGGEKIKLLKLEAEGLEPEILMGAINTLGRIEYIAVDGGPERGVRRESTIETVSTFLIRRGFTMVKIGLALGWGRTLFRRLLD